jgi:AcrR family transcriptional regulator
MRQKLATRQLILNAVISCIEEHGLENVTTRRIARQAGTNIASINYHFRSKDELIAQTLSLTVNHMLEDIMLALADSQKPFETTLRDVFLYLLEGSWRYPGISRAHLAQAVIAGRKDSVGARAMVKVYNGLVERAVRAYPRKDREILRMRLAQVMYSIMFLLLTPDFFGVASRRRATKAQQAQVYAGSFATLFLRGI